MYIMQSFSTPRYETPFLVDAIQKKIKIKLF